MNEFLQRLKKRKLVQWAVAYVAAAFALLQGIDIVAQQFGWPEGVRRGLTLAMVVGFFVTLVLAWYHGERGAQRVGGTELLILALLLAIGGGLLWRFAAGSHAPAVREANSTTPVAIPEKSIAVLPFVNMSSDKEQDYFSDGLSEELLNQLAQVPQLRVIARTSSFSFKGKEVDVATISKALNVANVLEGSVRKSANTLRITAQLIRTADSSHLWSETYDRELTDVFKVQDEISRDVVTALKVKLLPSQQPANSQRTNNPEAYEQVLIGKEARRHGGYESFQRALVASERAVELDPNYANAYAGLAQAQAFIADFSPTPAERALSIKRGFANADKAIDLAPDLPAGYWVRGILRQRLNLDWKGALSDFEKAAALNPNDVETFNYAQSLFFSGHQAEAIAMDRKATAVDPLSPEAWNVLGWHYAFAGQYAEAKPALLRALELSPDAQWSAFLLGYVELKEGQTDSAAEYFRRAAPAFLETGLAMLEYTLGHEKESQQFLAELKEKYAIGFAYQIAQACAWRGDKDGAFAWLDRAYEQHDAGLYRLRYDPILANLKGDSRFAALEKNLGFSK